MKNIFTFFLIISFSTNSYSQSFSVKELENMSKYNWDTFDTFISNKGYIFNKNSSNDTFKSKVYAYAKNNISTYASSWIGLYKYVPEYEEVSSAVTWQTLNQKEYLIFKNQLKISGYIYIQEKVENEYTVLTYKKGKKQIVIYLGRSKDYGNNDITTYEINLENLK